MIIDEYKLEKNGLLKPYYRCADFWICRVADWADMIVTVTKHVASDEDTDGYINYAAWFADKDFVSKIIANNKLFYATMLSNKTSRLPDLTFTANIMGCELYTIRDEVRNNLRPSAVDPELEHYLKGIYVDGLRPYVNEFGFSPKFSPKKVWVCVALFLLYPFGLPWFYANKKTEGFIMLGLFVGFMLLPILPIIAVIGILALVLMVRLVFQILSCKVKDKNGLVIATKARQKYIIDSVNTVREFDEQNKSEV